MEKFNFRSGTVEVAFPSDNIPMAIHHCMEYPAEYGRYMDPTKMNFRISNKVYGGIYRAGLFCSSCGFRFEFRYGVKMLVTEITEQLSLGARCSW
ncbi:MAG: hypothetical protein Q7R91_00210 [bacterium]|nr:hypothetical protein [bacterium]